MAKERLQNFSSLSLLLSPGHISLNSSKKAKIASYKKKKIQTLELDDMLAEKTLKDANKLAMTEANKELIIIHKKHDIENNFMMKAFKKQK